jgi:S-adenosylmethionine-dependent methyltransferase
VARVRGCPSPAPDPDAPVLCRQRGRHILDVGAGQGTESIRLARDGYRLVAVEPDPGLRGVFAQALVDEPAEVRQRVDLRAGSIGDLAGVVGDVSDGGLLAVAMRTTTSALWRPAARQNWAAALAAFDEYDAARAQGRDMRYRNEIGAPARADDIDDLTATAATQGLRLENWYGVRIAVNADELDPPADPDTLEALLAVEERLGATDPYRQLGQLAHLILRKPAVAAG